MATVIITVLLVAAVAAVVYTQFLSKKRKAAGCSKCQDVGCPLFDQAQRLKANNQKHA
ncbi:FeoB-associated Cys-rich membrane protein [Lacticaseibacillus kribbianus]|uniref:FeoB-associated Cys-rich membrane protein n=1 Tax=Lacticaseibacillus kribbianus TaxID=2926292 RepID=UPI001CD4B0C4|nr:FeoB-associated Cys-rich membrane protein [Lacticaseibacillus kribbianus]